MSVKNEIKSVLTELQNTDPLSPEYAILLNRLKELHNIKKEQQFLWPHILQIAGNVLVGVGILAFEREHILTTKAVMFFKR